MKLENNVTIITGGGQGIGEAYARRFAAEGARVAVADINREKGEAVAAAIRGTGADAIFVPVDVSDEQSTIEMAGTVVQKWGRVDTLIANAAIYYDIDNANHSYEYLKKIFSVNYFGSWLSCRAVWPHMKKQNKGSIITQSSDAAYTTFYVPHGEQMPSFHYRRTARDPLQRNLAGSDDDRGDQEERSSGDDRHHREHDDGHQAAARGGGYVRRRGLPRLRGEQDDHRPDPLRGRRHDHARLSRKRKRVDRSAVHPTDRAREAQFVRSR